MKFKYLFDDITIHIWYLGNFVSMEDIVRKCNPILNLLKFISNKKILSEVIVICCNQVCNQTLSIRQLMQERERERERMPFIK